MGEIHRNLAEKLKHLLGMFPVVCILGVRQAGKTTLAKQVCPSWKYIDLERQSDLERLTADPEFFFEEYPENLVIDEAQRCPDVFNILRSVIDADRNKKGRFIITGSSSPELLHGISESLAGRIATLNLGTLKANELYNLPLSDFYQIFTQKNVDKNNFPLYGKPQLSTTEMRHCWLFGGYPEPLLNIDNRQFYNLWMENYFDTYVNRDLARLFPRLNKNVYQRFIRMLGQLSGTILNQNDLARALEVSAPTVKEYLDIAAGTFVWQPIPSFETDVVKSTIKMPKGYFTDTGLLHYFLRIDNFDSLYFSPMCSKSFEAFVIAEINKGLEATFLTNYKVFYYRTKSKVEIDLIIQTPNGLIPIEIKQGSTVSRSDIKNLKSFMREQNLMLGILINQADEIEWLTNDIVQIPIGFL